MELSLAAARGPPEIIGSGRQVMILPWRWDWLGHWTPRYILDLAAASGCDLTLALELALGFGCRGMIYDLDLALALGAPGLHSSCTGPAPIR